MTNDKLGLFSTEGSDAIRHAKLIEITRLRALARQHLDAHNKLVGQLWALDMQSADTTDETVKAHIALKKNQLTKKLEDFGYDKKHQQAIEAAKALEIEVHGHSDLGSHSFYVL